MQFLINLTLMLVMASATNVFASAGKQQNEDQNAAPAQQTQDQAQSSRSAMVQSVTGCVMKTEQGYSLKTDSGDTYPIETQKDMSEYANKQVTVTGILEHENSPTPSASGNSTTVTDIRLRMVTTVVGDCNQPSK